MKLMSTTDFVLQFGKEENRLNYEQAYHRISAYANFLKQDLNIGMFVPSKLVNNIWLVLEEPENYNKWSIGKYNADPFVEMIIMEEYQESKSNVLFEGFYSNTEEIFHKEKSLILFEINLNNWNKKTKKSKIEGLVKYNLILTPAAKEQILL